MGFTPQFVDIDKDGRMDIITGHHRGYVSWFRGTENGFSTGEYLEQEGNPDSADYRIKSQDDVRSFRYWLYSTVSFGDFDDDGLPDMIVGGSSLRISKNVGTKTQPQFSKRKLLRDIKGTPLKIGDFFTKKEKEEFMKYGDLPPIGGSYYISPVVVDWDQDGVLDILVSDHYTKKGWPAVTFFRGLKTREGHRFEQGVSLFKGKDNAKVFPGRWLKINVADWNNDGINDLIIGTSVVTLHDDVFNPYLSWNWEKETGIVQKVDPGNMKNLPQSSQNYWLEKYFKAKTKKEKIPAEDYRTLRHRGYVYVMLGEKRD